MGCKVRAVRLQEGLPEFLPLGKSLQMRVGLSGAGMEMRGEKREKQTIPQRKKQNIPTFF